MKRFTIKIKLKEWIRRYLPAEILGTLTALLSATAVYYTTKSYPLAAVAGTIGENIGYYGYFGAIEWARHHHNHRQYKTVHRTVLVLSKTTRDLVVEFGPAEVLDSLLVRPFFMYITPQLIQPYALGLFIGKITADLVFYCLAVAGYEAKKRWVKS